MTDQSGECKDAVNTRVRSTWKKFHELQLILTINCKSIERGSYVWKSCVCKKMLYTSVNWPKLKRYKKTTWKR